MDKTEAEKLVEMERERGEPMTGDTVEKLVELFSKDINDYTKEDFTDGTEPYEYLYLYIDQPFVMEQKRLKIDAVARKCGIRNFTKLFKDYCKKKGTNLSDLNVTDFPMQTLTLRCGNYMCDSSGVRLDMETVCPHPIMPVQRLVNIDTGIEKIKIAYYRKKGWRTAIFDRKTISSANKITELSDIEVSVTSESAKSLVKYFAKLEELNMDTIEETECTIRMGWIKGEEKPMFSPYLDSVVFDGETNYKHYFENVRCKGDLKKWTDFIDENIRRGSIISRIVFASSLSSVLIKPLGCLPFLIHLWGETESGKSVLAMCAASIWANPEIGEFIQTFNATLVGMEKTAAFFNNLPLFLDELQIVSERKDFEKEIYMLTEGTGRTRGNKTGGVDTTPTWRNCIITTGEKPILTARSGGGAVNRVIEVECKEKFFKAPRAAANLVKANYGFFGKGFVSKLIDSGFAHSEELFCGYYNQLINDYDIMQKQAQSAALILTADKLAEELLFSDTPSLTPKEISDFLKTKASVSANPRAYEYVCEFVAANQNRFSGNAEFSEVWGVMDDSKHGVYIMKNKFNQICDEGGYNAQSLLSWLSDHGWIRRTDKKHYDVVKRIGNASVRCVHMTLSNAENEDYSDIDL